MIIHVTTTTNKWRCLDKWIVAVVALSVLTVAAAAQTTTIYQDNFNRNGELLGSAPNVVDTGGATWFAATNVFVNGSAVDFSGTNGYPIPQGSWSLFPNAFLPFTPQNGHVYTLSADIETLSSYPANQAYNWTALGFATSEATNNYYASLGADYTMPKNNTLVQFFAGPGTSNPVKNGGGNNWPGPPNDVFNNYKLVLDTTTPLWSIALYTNGVELASATYSSNPSINYVGLGANYGVSYMDNFTLTEAVPEPSAIGLVTVGGLLLALLRWGTSRRRQVS